MYKFAAQLFVATCLIGYASSAQAVPCTLAGTLSCSLAEGQNSANPEYGVLSAADLADVGGVTDWFEAWTFVLDDGTAYTGAADNAHISDIVHINRVGAEMWSIGFTGAGGGNTSFGATFAAIIASALALGPGGTVQVVGDPLFPGARHFTTATGGEIGLANEGSLDGIAHLVDLVGPGFSGDTLNILSAADRPIPEPATLTLVGIGGAVAAYRRRRKATV